MISYKGIRAQNYSFGNLFRVFTHQKGNISIGKYNYCSIILEELFRPEGLKSTVTEEKLLKICNADELGRFRDIKNIN